MCLLMVHYRELDLFWTSSFILVIGDCICLHHQVKVREMCAYSGGSLEKSKPSDRGFVELLTSPMGNTNGVVTGSRI